MSTEQVFSPKDPEEKIALVWDFADVLSEDEEIDTCEWKIISPEQNGEEFPDMLSGSVMINGTKVRQVIDKGTSCITYQFRIKITTSLGLVFIEKPTMLVTSK